MLPAGLIAAVGKSCATAANIVSIPVWLHVLGEHDFGRWAMAAAAVGVFLAFSDLGLGSALMSPLARGLEQRDHRKCSMLVQEISALLRLLGGLWCLLLVGAGFALLSGGMEMKQVATWLIPGLVIGVSLPWMIGSRLWQAAGDFRTSAGTDLLSAAIYLAGVGICWFLGGNLLAALVLLAAAPAAANALATYRWRTSHPSPESPGNAEPSRNWWLAGAPFLVLQVCSVAIATVDPLVVGLYLQPSEAGHYAIVSRWFLVAQTGLALLVLPLWPAIAAASARGDHAWVRRMVARATLTMALGGGVLLAGWGLLAHWGIPFWTANVVHPDPAFLATSVMAAVAVNTGAVYAMFLNGAGHMRFQVLVCVVLAPLLLVSKWTTAAIAPMWCIPLTTAVAYLGGALIPYLIHARQALRAPMSS